MNLLYHISITTINYVIHLFRVRGHLLHNLQINHRLISILIKWHTHTNCIITYQFCFWVCYKFDYLIFEFSRSFRFPPYVPHGQKYEIYVPTSRKTRLKCLVRIWRRRYLKTKQNHSHYLVGIGSSVLLFIKMLILTEILDVPVLRVVCFWPFARMCVNFTEKWGACKISVKTTTFY